MRPGVTVTGVRRDGRGRVAGVSGHDRAGAPVELDARFVVGADGLRSRVARSVGAADHRGRPAGGAAQYAYYAGVPWSGIEFFVAERSFAGVFPTHDGEACIWVCTPAADATAVRRRSRSRVEAFDQLLERRPQSWPSGCVRPADLAGRGHAAAAQPAPPGVRAGLGTGRRRRLPPRRDHRPRHQRRLPRRRAARRRARPGAARRGRGDHALAGYQQQRDQALREIFEITCALAAYPPVPEFVELQKQLSAAIDAEAAALAARPIPGERLLATA